MIVIALAAVASAGAGLVAERQWPPARELARRILQTMLYVLVPFVAYVSIAHLRITASGAAGLGLGWIAVLLTAVAGAWLGRHALRLADRQLGAFIVCAIVVNTGYLGNPIISTLLGAKALREGVAWDQLVSSPALFLLGFGVAAHYSGSAAPWRSRALRFITRNPPLWGVVAGLIASPRWAPSPLPTISRGVVDGLLVCGFFAAGVYLSSERGDEQAPFIERPNRVALTAVATRLLLMPLILIGLSSVAIAVPAAYLVQATMPTGLNTLLIGHAYDLDQRLISSVIVWTSLVVIVGALLVGA